MWAPNALGRLLLSVSLALSAFVALSHAAPNPDRMTKHERVQAMVRQLGSFGITGVQSGRGDDGSVPFRLEIRELQKNTDQWNLYLLGLARLQAVPADQLLSYYQIAGIHGRPYVNWDNVSPAPGQQNQGYCTHSSILFPTWHRPYLALYEQVLYNAVVEVANEFGEESRERYVNASATFRMPYWDWASAEGGGVLPSSISDPTVQVTTPQGEQTIPNPLFSYTFPRDRLTSGELGGAPWSGWQSTVRYPTDTSPGAQSQHDQVSAQLNNNRLAYRDRLYILFSNYNNYTMFSNKAWYPGSGYDSVESVHDQIHGLVGTRGHMSSVPHSSFDPIFWLHHTMVDRVFAIWQALYPNEYVQPFRTQWGTYTIPRGSIEDVNTPLTPFHTDGNNNFYTSASSRDVKRFGYTYPELVDWGVDPAQFQANVRAAVNQLYGQTAPANTLQRRGLGFRKPHKKLLIIRANETDPTPENTPEGLVTPENTYYEYIANIRVKKFALRSSFFVHVFVGDYNSDPACWSFDVNLAGSHCVFADDPATMDVPEDVDLDVSGAIPLTSSLINAISNGKLASLDPEDVDPFLKANLHWRVGTMDDEAVDNEKVAGLTVFVVASEVEKPSSETELPKWGNPVTLDDVTRDDPTGLHDGEPTY